MLKYFPLSAIAILALLQSSQAFPGCGPDQTRVGNLCAQLYRPSADCSSDFTFQQAQAFCRNKGGELASIHNQAQEDAITALIQNVTQRTREAACGKQTCSCGKTKVNACKCAHASRDYNYWIGLRLTHNADQDVSGVSWTDNSNVDYGNPLENAPFRPPWAEGRPVGSVGDGRDPVEVCPEGNQNDCTQIVGYGSNIGRWQDVNCSNSHQIKQQCNCTAKAVSALSQNHHHNHNSHEKSSSEEAKHNHHHHHDKKSSRSSSSSSDEDKSSSHHHHHHHHHEDEEENSKCHDTLNGFICIYCPPGWTPFQGNCYRAVGGGGGADAYAARCAAYGTKVTSIHSDAENIFVADLATAAFPNANVNYLPLKLVHASDAISARVISADWTDGSPADWGNPVIVPWSTFGTYPWNSTPQLKQPNNRELPADCVHQGLPPNEANYTYKWNDEPCSANKGAAVCKLVVNGPLV